MVPYSNEYVNEFKERYMQNLQAKKDEIDLLEKQYWETMQEYEARYRHHEEFIKFAESEAHEHQCTNHKFHDAVVERQKAINEQLRFKEEME